MRLIDADALYRKVKTECNPYGKPTIGFEDGNRVMNWIEQAPTVSGWISVKDRLPEEDGDYLAYAFGFVDRLRFADGVWWDYGDECQPGVITHWMPLPEPPEEAEP